MTSTPLAAFFINYICIQSQNLKCEQKLANHWIGGTWDTRKSGIKWVKHLGQCLPHIMIQKKSSHNTSIYKASKYPFKLFFLHNSNLTNFEANIGYIIYNRTKSWRAKNNLLLLLWFKKSIIKMIISSS